MGEVAHLGVKFLTFAKPAPPKTRKGTHTTHQFLAQKVGLSYDLPCGATAKSNGRAANRPYAYG
ncbi:hypothetical protein PSE10C_43440 [Pseudomonas amygdali pv. eriobotryae]|nr:hypothetical protein PSE10C_43440 [Pseudomonas amygdali pv. eriobotryae]